MSMLWSPAVENLRPYTPGEQPRQTGLTKLNTNENPFGPSPRVADAIQSWPTEKLKLYPDPESMELRLALAEIHGVDVDQIFVGNGSDEVLAHAFCALFRQDLPILMPDISYGFYRTYCQLYGIAHIEMPLDKKFRVNVDDYTQPCGGVVFANPNAPTGVAIASGEIECLLAMHPNRAVLVDEAYVDFGGDSVIPLIASYPNLLVTRTFSKSRGLAGIRVGYALGSPELVSGLNRVKNSFNSYPLSMLSSAAAIASLEDHNYFVQTVCKIVHLRQKLVGALVNLGLTVLPSSTNFVFATHPNCSAAILVAGLRQRGVIVRNFDIPRIRDFMRITVGSESDCQALLSALEQVLRESSEAKLTLQAV